MQILIKLLLCLCPVYLTAQNCKLQLKGNVSDADNREGLAFAYLKIVPGNLTVQSDEQGKFNFTSLCPGTYTLYLQHLGCRDTAFVLQLEKDKRVQYTLPHALNELKDIEIISQHEAPPETQAVAVLDKKMMTKVAGLSLADQLKQLNGLTTLNTGPTISKPMINGMQGYRILILNNNVRLEGQQWGNEHAPEIDPYAADKLTVIRGASAVRYGSDAIGGVILSTPANLPRIPSFGGEASLSGFTNGRGGTGSLRLEGNSARIKQLSWRLQGSAKESGSIRTPDYFLKNTANNERNFSALVDYHQKNSGWNLYYAHYGAKVGIFSGSHIGNLSDLYAAFNRNKPQDSLADFSYQINRPYQNIQHDLLKLSADFHTGHRSRFKVQYAWQKNHRQEFDKSLPRNAQLAALNLPAADYKLETQSMELVWEHDYIRSFRGSFGLQGSLQTNRYTQRFFIPNYNSEALGLFAIERFVRPKFEIEAGLRADYKHLKSFFYDQGTLKDPVLIFSNQSLQLGLLLKLLPKLKISLHGGNGWRPPAPNELYSNGLHHGVGAIEKGNANLESEKCLNVISNFNFENDRLQISWTAYHYAFSNFIYYSPAPQAELTIRGAFPVFQYAQCKAAISGSDLLLKYQIVKGFSVKARGMLLKGNNLTDKTPLIYMPSNRAEFSVELNLKAIRKIKGIYFEPAFTMVSQQKNVPPGTDFIDPPPAYHLISATAGCELILNKQRIFLSLSVSNAGNVKYRDYLDRFRYYNDAAGSNYTLRIRIPFNFNLNKETHDN